jgi:integrase
LRLTTLQSLEIRAAVVTLWSLSIYLGLRGMPTLKLRQDITRSLPYVGANGKHQCIYWDSALECFGLRVYPSGRRTFVYSYWVHRRKRLGTIGRADVLTLEDARRKAKALLGQVASQHDPQNLKDQMRKALTITQLAEVYIENYAKLKKRSWKQDESVLKRLLIPALGTRLAMIVTTADIQQIHTEKGSKHPGTANSFLIVVRKLFNWAPTAGHLPKGHTNPAVGITGFPKRKRRRFLTTAEMPRFIQALEQEDSEYAKHALWLLLLTGLRMRELLKAKWADIDWDAGTLFIGLTKNGEPLLAPLSDEALARLRHIPRLASNPYIICGKSPGEHFRELGPVLRRILRRAAIENLRVHDLRRTVGSWLAQGGTTLHLIGDVLNHLDPKTTAGYAYFQTQQRRDVLTQHANKVLSCVPQQSRVVVEPKTLSANQLLRTDASAPADGSIPSASIARRHFFEREELYKLVWIAPVSEVARKLGVSDVGLAKLCRRAAVPVPGRGYWARVEAGQHIGAEPLPPAPEGLPQLLGIRARATSNKEGVASSVQEHQSPEAM